MGDAYEVHITVAPLQPFRVPHFRETCVSIGVKPLVIALDKLVQSQPMTCSVVTGPMAHVIAHVEHICDKLIHAGFQIVRRKVEASPRNRKLAQNASRLDESIVYLESHLKFLIRSDEEHLQLSDECRNQGGTFPKMHSKLLTRRRQSGLRH